MSISAANAEVNMVSFNGEPWATSHNGGPGVIPSFYSELQGAVDQTLKVKILPYPRMIEMLKTGQSDFAVFFKSAKSAKVADPLVKLTSLSTIALPAMGQKLETYQDLLGKKIGVKRGVAIQPRFDKDKRLLKLPFTNYQQGVKMLLAGHIDILVGSDVAIYYNLAKQGHKKIRGNDHLELYSREVWLQISKRSALPYNTIKQIVDKAQELADRNRYRQIIDDKIEQVSM